MLSRFQVSQNGLDVCGLLIERLGVSFRPYVNTVLPPTVDRLGDSKEAVRERAASVLNRWASCLRLYRVTLEVISVKFPSAQAEKGRHWNDQNYSEAKQGT